MATRTTTQDGNWNLTATWGGSAPPALGTDIAVIWHEVTVSDAQGAGLKTSNPADRAIEFNGAGGLTIQDGGYLTVGGRVHCVDDCKIRVEAGGILEGDVPEGVVYDIKHYDEPLELAGAEGNHCVVRSKAGGGRINIPCWGTFPAPIAATYCDFLRVGDASTPAINVPLSVADSVSLTHCTFDDCGELSVDNQLGEGVVVVVEDCTFTNSAHATRSATLAGVKSTGSSFARNAFDKAVNFVGPAGWTIEDCYFAETPALTGTAWTGASSVPVCS